MGASRRLFGGDDDSDVRQVFTGETRERYDDRQCPTRNCRHDAWQHPDRPGGCSVCPNN